jgi:hypothetical protein
MKDINVISTGSCGRGMTYWDREITTDQYERAQANNGRLTEDDEKRVLTDSELYGYGASATSVYELDGHYFVRCHRYNSCD